MPASRRRPREPRWPISRVAGSLGGAARGFLSLCERRLAQIQPHPARPLLLGRRHDSRTGQPELHPRSGGVASGREPAGGQRAAQSGRLLSQRHGRACHRGGGRRAAAAGIRAYSGHRRRRADCRRRSRICNRSASMRRCRSAQMQDFKDSTQVIAVASQGGLGLPNRDYYLKSEPTFKPPRAATMSLHVARMFVLLGDTPAAAARESKAVMALETRLARHRCRTSNSAIRSAIYHPMTLARRGALTPHLRLARDCFAALGHPEIASLNVGMPEFFQAVDRELTRTSLADWKTYLRWQLIDAYAPYLPSRSSMRIFAWRRCSPARRKCRRAGCGCCAPRMRRLGFAIGEMYVAQKFSARRQAGGRRHGRAHSRRAARGSSERSRG